MNAYSLTDENGNRIYPIGHADAIYDSSGNVLSSVISDKISAVEAAISAASEQA